MELKNKVFIVHASFDENLSPDNIKYWNESDTVVNLSLEFIKEAIKNNDVYDMEDFIYKLNSLELNNYEYYFYIPHEKHYKSINKILN